MAGNNQRSLRKTIIPPGEAQTLYSPDLLALLIQNLRVTSEGTLRAVRGPAILEPDREQGYPLSGNPHGIYHGSLAGHDDTLLVRVGTKLYRQAGWERGFEELETGLTDETEPRFPDQFIRFADRVIWTNGIDRPRVITFDGMVIPLGFSRAPSAPVVQGPRSPKFEDRSTQYPNTQGYPWPGRIGTPGDTLSGQAGSVLTGSWYFFEVHEDIHGNLSPPSAASNAVTLNTIQADPWDADGGLSNHGFEIDDLTKQFRVISGGDSSDDHCVARRLYRTPDTRNAGNIPQFVARMAGRRGLDYSCSISDAELGFPMDNTIAAPVFKVACVHNGRLVIGNTTGDPTVVRRSEPGYPGTFLESEFTFPDDEGGEITGLASHGGRLLAFTESAVYDCTDFGNPVAISKGIGCVSPSSIRTHGSGLLIWLGRGGFYGMTTSGAPESISTPIQQELDHRVNRGRLNMATAALDPETGEYVCGLSEAGYAFNTLLFSFSGTGWRRYWLGPSISGLTGTKDWRGYLLFLGLSAAGDTHVFVFDHETAAYTPSKQQVRYHSAILMSDEVGLHPVEVHKLYIGLRDRWDGEMLVYAYKNGSTNATVSAKTVKLLGPDEHDNQALENPSSHYRDVLSRAIVGTAQVHEPRLYWRKVDLNMKDVTNWRFELIASYPTDVEIAAFCFEISRVVNGNPLSRIPDGSD